VHVRIYTHTNLFGGDAHVGGVVVIEDESNHGGLAVLAFFTFNQRKGAVLQSTA
jgi:hypothetical protein